MIMGENIAKTIPEWKDMLESEGKKTHANVTITFELPDGGQFILKYKQPQKPRRK